MKKEISENFEISIFEQLAVDVGGDGNSLGYMELLGTQDFSHSLFDLLPPTPVGLPPTSIEAFNLPETPKETSCISSSPTEAPFNPDPAKEQDELDLGTEKKQSKGGKKMKKGQKRQREPIIAFLTKSETDRLDDGYRWRKYGQKAVRGSSHPRSYYRCTTAACGVKKHVGRLPYDPTVVVTAYEGKHTHFNPALTRGGRQMDLHYGFGAPPVQLNELSPPCFFGSITVSPPTISQPVKFCHVATSDRRYYNPMAGHLARDYGLLEDLMPRTVQKLED